MENTNSTQIAFITRWEETASRFRQEAVTFASAPGVRKAALAACGHATRLVQAARANPSLTGGPLCKALRAALVAKQAVAEAAGEALAG